MTRLHLAFSLPVSRIAGLIRAAQHECSVGQNSESPPCRDGVHVLSVLQVKLTSRLKLQVLEEHPAARDFLEFGSMRRAQYEH